jgi:hypothetical protein
MSMWHCKTFVCKSSMLKEAVGAGQAAQPAYPQTDPNFRVIYLTSGYPTKDGLLSLDAKACA